MSRLQAVSGTRHLANSRLFLQKDNLRNHNNFLQRKENPPYFLHKRSPTQTGPGNEAKMSLTGETGENGGTMEAGEGGSDGSMSGGKFVPVAIMKAAKVRRRGLEDHRGDSGPTSERPWRRCSHLSAVEGQRRMAWLNVSSSFPHLGPCLGSRTRNHGGWVAR